jgi:hypothetical protein
MTNSKGTNDETLPRALGPMIKMFLKVGVAVIEIGGRLVELVALGRVERSQRDRCHHQRIDSLTKLFSAL